MSASTGSRLAAGQPAAAGVAVRTALDSLDALEKELLARLAAIARSGEEARGFASSVERSLARQRAERVAVRRRLGLLPSRPPAAAPPGEPDLEALRAAQSDLTFACAEAIGAVADPRALDRLVEHLRELAGQLAVVELWIEREQGLE